jgi:putative endonuclease
MNNKQKIGQIGENLAHKYLAKKGYKIIERNFRRPWGEIDIIAIAPDKTLVFVEVKSVQNNKISAEEQLTKTKLKKLQKTASLYANTNNFLQNSLGWQIDLIAITISNKKYNIKHYKNI